MSKEVIILCILVLICRVFDVTLATIRTVITVQGKTKTATIIAFIETFMWFMIIREALNFDTSDSIVNKLNIAFAYALGYATGTAIGSTISKFIPYTVEVQIVSSKKDKEMIKALQEKGFELTVLTSEATQFSGEKYIILSAISNKMLKDFKKLVYELDPKAFITLDEVKGIYYGSHSIRNVK